MPIHVLFANADPKIIQALQEQMRLIQDEWDCRFAASADEALTMLKKHPCDVIVADHLLAQNNGASLLASVMNDYPQVIRFAFIDESNQAELARLGNLAHQYLPNYEALPIIRETIEAAFAMRDILAGENLKKIISRIKKLPSLPTVYLEILKELRSGDPSLKEIGILITKDSGLSVQMLKLVNSSYFGLRNTVTTPAHAISMLGLETVQSVVLAADIFEQFDRLRMMVPNFSLEEFQKHSMLVSNYAGKIAKAEGWDVRRCSDLSMAGLLHDIGQLVLVENFPREYTMVLEAARSEHVDVWMAELLTFGVTHAEISAYLLGLWGITESIVNACRYHHLPNFGRLKHASPVSILHVANAFAVEPDMEKLDEMQGLLDIQFLQNQQLVEKLPVWRAACPVEDVATTTRTPAPRHSAPHATATRQRTPPPPSPSPQPLLPSLGAKIKRWFS